MRDGEMIHIAELYHRFKDAQQERLKCGNRFFARMIGRLYLSEEGGYPEGRISDMYDALKATDPIYLVHVEEEKLAKRELERKIKDTRIGELFDSVHGCGPSIIGGLVSVIMDIRRFPAPANLASYLLGLRMLTETGKFPRARRGMTGSYSRDGRQALYTLGGMFNYAPNSEWGLKLRANREYYKARHPDVLFVEKRRDNGAEVETGVTYALVTKLEPVMVKDEQVMRKSYWYLHPDTGVEVKVGKGLLSYVDGEGNKVKVRGAFRYNDAHLQNMAVWKTLREFVVDWLYPAWQNLEQQAYEPKEAKRRRSQKAA
jgi:hypothetical protein